MQKILRKVKGLNHDNFQMKIWHGTGHEIYNGDFDIKFLREFINKRLPSNSKVVLREEPYTGSREELAPPFEFYRYIIETDCSNGFWKHVHIYIHEKY